MNNDTNIGQVCFGQFFVFYSAKVYRCYDRFGVLLYVGLTDMPNMKQRLEGHRYESPWFNQVRKIKVKTYYSGEAARWAKEVAIKTEDPLYNIVHKRKVWRGRMPKVING